MLVVLQGTLNRPQSDSGTFVGPGSIYVLCAARYLPWFREASTIRADWVKEFRGEGLRVQGLRFLGLGCRGLGFRVLGMSFFIMVQ